MIIKAIILGIIEGLTEFLPVSSTGHLIIANRYLNFTGSFANAFAVVIQVGAIFAVVLYFKDKVFPEFGNKRRMAEYISLWTKVVVGVIPAVILGLLFDDYIEEHFFNPTTVAAALIFGAILLLLGERGQKKARVISEKHISYKQAFIVGIAQCMALWPGMSRSASTIIGGLFVGFSRKVAAEFSFFLAIPTLIGAAILKLFKMGLDFTSYEWLVLAVGTFVSFVVAYFVIAFFMNYIKKRKLSPFAYYRIILGIIVLLAV
jgi:undecaprenyl-diphosphatase